ncbi:hypothetical protein KPH14_009596 [Odynerus spinipes]|uniref:Uncharacterized protein n=1 Tax=Odynerus spinipes TaxID=1348599 RepID=A0AAD9RPQ1_9HYME|nr:hypothetical protein KPH14_009596 [Odynerus spinipes]
MRTEIETIVKPTTVTSNDTPASVDVEPVVVARPTVTSKQLPQEDPTTVSSEVPLNVSKKETSESPATIANVPSPSQQTSNAKSGDLSNKSHVSESEEDGKCAKGKKSRSGKRLSIEPPPERKNLRSSAGRQARAAAERQARMECELQSEHQQQSQEQQQQQQQQSQQQDTHVGNE